MTLTCWLMGCPRPEAQSAHLVCAIFQGARLHAARRADEPLVRRPVGGLVPATATNTLGVSPPGCSQDMPVIVAVGINLGIVPLLFIQVAYYKFFYPATILMAVVLAGDHRVADSSLLRRLCLRLGTSRRRPRKIAFWKKSRRLVLAAHFLL